MLGRLARELPDGEFLYEPKWDGFRALVFRDRDEVDLRSRHGRPLARYFPELVDGVRSLACDRLVLDGEIVVEGPSGFDFPTLMARLHPTPSRVERLRREAPASFLAFDLLAEGDASLLAAPLRIRRRRLEGLLVSPPPPVFLSPATEEADVAASWLQRFRGGGLDGVVAKHLDLPYEPGRRAMVKVKTERTADCVVAGFRWASDRPVLGSLLLGLHDEHGGLRHVGVVTAFTAERRTEVLHELAPLVAPLAGHPWERGFGLGRSPLGRLLGAAGRWAPGEMEMDWVPVRPELVCEVAYDQLDHGRFRHPARFRRWRPDRDPRSCGFGQLETAPPELARRLVPA